MTMSDRYWILLVMAIAIVVLIYRASLAMKKRQNISLGRTHMHGLMYCSGFDLRFSTSPDASFGEGAVSPTKITVEAFQTKYAGEELPNPRELVKKEFRVMHNQIQPEMLSVKTDDRTPMGHPCNDRFLLRFLVTKKMEAGTMPSEFEISETQSGIKVDLKQGVGWSHSVAGRKLTLYGADGIKVDFESHRGHVD
jgi:hypothetical protein